jgi:hypothetical protein
MSDMRVLEEAFGINGNPIHADLIMEMGSGASPAHPYLGNPLTFYDKITLFNIDLGIMRK